MATFNRLVHGDCIEVVRTLPSSSVGLVLTDPPYGVRYKDRTNRSIANDDDVRGILRVFPELFRVLKPNTYCISFYGWNKIDDFMAAWRRAGFTPVGHIVWTKNYTSSRGFLNYRHEQAYLLAKGRPAKPAEPLDDVMPWHYSGNKAHPTEKSIKILRPLIRSFSNPGDVVLDPFSGSASTSIAAVLEGRGFFGVELDAEYYRLSQQRMHSVLGTRAPTQSPAIQTRDLQMADFGRWLQQRGYSVPNRWFSQEERSAWNARRDDWRSLN